jgi:hypothetical protein
MFGNGPKTVDPYVTTVGLVQKGRDPGSSQLLKYMMVLPFTIPVKDRRFEGQNDLL